MDWNQQEYVDCNSSNYDNRTGLYGRNSGGELSPAMISIILNIGLSMSICSDGFLMVGTTIAEEKEKHTLRVLMTSSVTGVQYFIGSILLPFILTVGVNLAVLFFSGESDECKYDSFAFFDDIYDGACAWWYV